MIQTMSVNEAAKYLRAHGLNISNAALADMIEQRVVPFGLCISGNRKHRVFKIFRRKLDEWIAEREAL